MIQDSKKAETGSPTSQLSAVKRIFFSFLGVEGLRHLPDTSNTWSVLTSKGHSVTVTLNRDPHGCLFYKHFGAGHFSGEGKDKEADGHKDLVKPDGYHSACGVRHPGSDEGDI